MGISIYAATILLEYVLSGDCYIALTTSSVLPSMDGSNIQEPLPNVYPNYTRIEITPEMWSTPVVSIYLDEEQESHEEVLASNNTILYFPTPQVGSGSLTVTGWAVLDSPTSGNVLYYGSCDNLFISTDVTPYFPANTLVVSVSA